MTSYPCNKYENITPSYLLSVKSNSFSIVNVFIIHFKSPCETNQWEFVGVSVKMGVRHVFSKRTRHLDVNQRQLKLAFVMDLSN